MVSSSTYDYKCRGTLPKLIFFVDVLLALSNYFPIRVDEKFISVQSQSFFSCIVEFTITEERQVTDSSGCCERMPVRGCIQGLELKAFN